VTLNSTTPHVTPFKLIDHGNSGASTFASGGTDLGEVLSHAVVGFEREGENVYKQTAGRHPTDYRWLGDVATLEVVLAARSSDVLKLMNRPQWVSTNSGLLVGAHQLKPGRRVKANSKTTRLHVAAMNDAMDTRLTTRPHLYIPYAFCVHVGPRQFALHGKLFEAAVLTILALYDETNGVCVYEGDYATFPALA
jgi:hypothetical protein